ncbi:MULTISPECIES: PDC sensor domain-containing protein [unclassified Leifsonia]|uniref:PDC sensor domain-containing protein n=1 Tax=unclassified Leifsonia TaxID=2663824 RepID=UPI0006FCE3F5|nr:MULTISPECIES: hypothetical protein [unclassified Leifsonia]KQX07162.1 hypothetical protein ASC59_05030 [Leifsonia sp. Root1293]KRA11445.1 hypothetical protein ASD61_05030 [Leifsonia sp. Root60]
MIAPTLPHVDDITAVFGAVFAPIAEWNVALTAELGSPAARTRRAVDSVVAELVRQELAREGSLVVGAGFVAAPGFLVDAPWHLAWWLGEGNSFGSGTAGGRASGRQAVRRLEAVEDPASDSFRDHTTLEWWRVPERTGRRHITGPYVDYLCTDDYTLTLTDPVFVDGRLVGVVGADVYVTEAERVLLTALRRIGGDASLVNASGRIVVSTDPRLATGSLVRDPAVTDAVRDLAPGASMVLADGRRVTAAGDTTLAVITSGAADPAR